MHIFLLFNNQIKLFYFFKLIKEIEDLKNELTLHKRQKEMIANLKIDLIQSKERVLSLEQRLQLECDSKVATYIDQLEKLKKEYEEKVTK